MNWAFIKSKSFLLPTVLWLLFVVVNVTVFQTGYTKHQSVVRTMIQWDGRLYLSIARDGYERFPCEHNPRNICGNGGWFPVYPMIGAAIAIVGLDHRYVMIGVSWLALWLALLVLYRLVLRRWSENEATAAVLALLLFPGSFYFLTTFPYSVFLLLAVAAFHLMEQEAYRWLWLVTGLLAATYPSGAVVALPIAYKILLKRGRLKKDAQLYLVLAVAGIPVALLIYFGYYWWKFDDFWLYVRIQSQSYYAHEPAFPLWVIGKSIAELPLGNPVMVSLLFTLAATVVFYSRRLPVTWQLFMFGVLLFTPTMGTTDCYYRHIIAAWPLAVMIALATLSSWRRYLLAVYALAAAAINWWLYLPAYKAGALM